MQRVPQDPGHAADVLHSVSLPHIYVSEPAMPHSSLSSRVKHDESSTERNSKPGLLLSCC